MMKSIWLGLSIIIGLASLPASAVQISRGGGGRATDPRGVGIPEGMVDNAFKRKQPKKSNRNNNKKLDRKNNSTSEPNSKSGKDL